MTILFVVDGERLINHRHVTSSVHITYSFSPLQAIRFGSPSGRWIPLDVFAELARMAEQAHDRVENQLHRIRGRKHRNHPPGHEFRSDMKSDVERSQKRDNTTGM